jgi:aryl-alcohol dehydrogenase-like predicted oxidoreductase
MEYRPLGNTDLNVSLICLGTMTWGEQNTADEAYAQLDMALDAGVNFIDTAELYSIPPKAETYGKTEEIIGQWLAARGNRDKVILASKVAAQSEWLPHIRNGKSRLDAPNIVSALEGSLKRLQTDYLDLYQLHWPDRTTNFFGKLGYTPGDDSSATPLLETLHALNEQVKAGKIRHIGLSNETAWGMMKCLQLADKHNLPPMVSVQNPYSLLNRSFEVGCAEVSCREGMGLLAYSPLAFGALSGKYLNGQAPASARLNLFPDYDRYSNPQAVAATEGYVKLAREHNLDPAQMALAFINSRPFTTSNIIGATNLQQLRSNIDSVDVTLSAEVLAGIEAVHTSHPYPSP